MLTHEWIFLCATLHKDYWFFPENAGIVTNRKLSLQMVILTQRVLDILEAQMLSLFELNLKMYEESIAN